MALMLLGGMTAKGQTDYVFMYNGNFLDSNTTTGTTSFVPNASIYSGTSGGKFHNANGYYIRYNYGLTFTTNVNNATNLTINSSGQIYYSSYYLNYYSNNNRWYMDNDAQQVVYQVTSSLFYDVTDFQVSGDDVLTSVGTNNSYSHTYAQVGSCTKYEFGELTYYSTNASNAASTTIPSLSYSNITTGYNWSLEGNGEYASVNTTSGAITVNSLPTQDVVMTLKCSVTSNGITKTAQMPVVIQGTIPNAPIISVSGTTVTLSSNASGSITIRYTLDGTNPTTTTGTEYSVPFDLTDSPTTIKAITVRNGYASDVAEQTVTLTLPAPVITVNGTAGTATISATTGATIYYTTDGSTPSASNGTQYTTGLTGLSPMTTIKAIAVKDGWNDSPVASATVTIPSGVSGGIVTLFDYEDHSWSYYSDATLPAQLRSLNPADVKITYYGNGTSNINTTNNATPASSAWTQNASTVKVGPNDNANTFVYYKTLERLDGSTSDNPTGRCAYTTIPNPFSVRPTYQYATGDLNKYCGFYMWRIKEIKNGKIYDGNGTHKTICRTGVSGVILFTSNLERVSMQRAC